MLPLIAVAVLLLAAAGFYYYYSTNLTQKAAGSTAVAPPDTTVTPEDLVYLATTLRPTASHWDVITAILTTPSNVQWSLYDQQRVQEAIRKRKEVLKEEAAQSATAATDFDDLVNGEGWADDDDDDEDGITEDDAARRAAAAAADAAEAQRLERLRQATGKTARQVEAVDEGVLGQNWVEQRLEEHGVWPPQDFGLLSTGSSGLKEPGIRRMLCIATGRLHSQHLNQHPELLQAGADKKLDQTYFAAAGELRMRVNMYLEASMRVAVQLQCLPLAKTIAETMRLFKIGITEENEKSKSWVDSAMLKTYKILPELRILSNAVGENDEGQTTLELECERIHAKNFLEQKLASCKQQGIPPQMGLQTFREPWWLFLECPTNPPPPLEDLGPLKDLPASAVARFRPPTIVKGLPVVITQVAQAKLKLTLAVPQAKVGDVFKLHVVSSEFLGTDHVVEFPVEVKKDK